MACCERGVVVEDVAGITAGEIAQARHVMARFPRAGCSELHEIGFQDKGDMYKSFCYEAVQASVTHRQLRAARQRRDRSEISEAKTH